MFFLKKYQDTLGLLLLWLLIIFIINPIGDFPLNDDWCYGKSVKTLYENNYLKLYNWGEMTLVAHVYFGYVFTELFGFSFTSLRVSTLFMGYATILGIYELLKLVNVKRKLRLLATTLCIVNPIFLALSFSFMTDVPFYAITVWILYFFVKALQTNRWKYIIIGILLSYWAFLIRQLAWVFPVVWLVTFLLTKKWNTKTLIKACVPLLAMLVFSIVFSYIMEHYGLLQERYNSKFKLLINRLKNFNFSTFRLGIEYFLVSLTYLGFLLAPFVLFFRNKFRFKRKKIVVFVFTLCVTLYLFKTGKTLPYLDNIWINFGIGPTMMYDFYDNVKLTPSYRPPLLFWQIVTALGVFSGVYVVFQLHRTIVLFTKNRTVSSVNVLLVLFFGIYLAPFLIVGVYDRYLLPLFPVVLILLANKEKMILKKIPTVFASIFIILLGYFSICATHDYLSWNRVRWQIVNELLKKDIPKNQIQAGGEYTTWYFFSEEKEKWWLDVKPVYTLVFNPKINENILKTYRYNRWLPGDNTIHLVQQKSNATKHQN